MPEKHFLRQMQALPLRAKVLKSKIRIREGLGMRKVFEDCNQIYGKDFIRYE